MPKALIIYASRTGDTKAIAELIAEGLRFSMIEVTVADVGDIKQVEDLTGYDIYVFGSSTYHGEMVERMKTMLFLAERAELQGKVAGAFGAYGWSGEAAERIYDTMKNIFKMEMVSTPLMLRSATLEGGVKVAQDYGRELGSKME